MQDSDLALPKGSLVLVTGANGFQASHVVDQLLAHGYRVRGTVRDAKKVAWTTEYFGDKYGKGLYEAVIVEDITVAGAFDQAVRDVAGVIHIACNNTLSPNATVVVPSAVAGALAILPSAAASPTVKRVVLTSSAGAAASSQPGVRQTVTPDSWNAADVAKAFRPRDQWGADQVITTINAMKTEEERESWAWVAAHRPRFTFNAVLPFTLLGRVLAPALQGFPTTAGMLKSIWDGQMWVPQAIPSCWMVDVQDSARLHLAALLFDDVKDERVFACAAPMLWGKMPGVMRRVWPGKEFPEDVVGALQDETTYTARGRAEELLKRIKGSGWEELDTIVRWNCEAFAEVEARQ